MRLDKYLSHAGLGTRKEVKQLLKTGRICVNGEPVKQPNFHVQTTDQITLDGEIVSYEEFVYYMMNKPQEVLSATRDATQPTVLDLLSDEDYRSDLFPVGRLDKDTVGLLLLTNDGALSHQLLSPKKHVSKEYMAEIVGIMTEKDQMRFLEGIELEGNEICQPARLEILHINEEQGTSRVKITLVEGKYHQVKRMVAACGKKVQHLQRISMGSLRLDDELAEGDYRRLSSEEIASLKKQMKSASN